VIGVFSQKEFSETYQWMEKGNRLMKFLLEILKTGRMKQVASTGVVDSIWVGESSKYKILDLEYRASKIKRQL